MQSPSARGAISKARRTVGDMASESIIFILPFGNTQRMVTEELPIFKIRP
jgi:hypothetical protein